MKSNLDAAAVDAVALITLARDDHVTEAELLILALDNLKSRPGESLGDMLGREAELVAVLATFSAALLDVLDDTAPGAGRATLQALGQKWAERLANPDD